MVFNTGGDVKGWFTRWISLGWLAKRRLLVAARYRVAAERGYSRYWNASLVKSLFDQLLA